MTAARETSRFLAIHLRDLASEVGGHYAASQKAVSAAAELSPGLGGEFRDFARQAKELADEARRLADRADAEGQEETE